MKKKTLMFFLLFLISLSVPLNVQAKENSSTDKLFHNNNSFTKVSPYAYEITYKSLVPKGIYLDSYSDITSLSNSNDTTLKIDFSDSIFYDEEGNVVDKDEVMKTIVPIDNVDTGDYSTLGASYSPGTLSTGSGYATNKGMKITGTEGIIALNIEYKADITRVQGGYDRIDRIYGAQVWGAGSWSWLSNGVFRKNETYQYSAYGGVKGQWELLGYGNATKHLYLRVGSDKIWLDHNIK